MEAFRSCPCPLLEEPYECDSVDLSDKETKSYWLHCIVDMLSSFRNQALKNNDNSELEDKSVEATNFYDSTKESILKLYQEEDYPAFSIRTQLDLIQQGLRRHGFTDPWRTKKRQENEQALGQLKSRLEEVDRIADPEDRWTELIKGVLAGNLFDWGAKAVSDILEMDGSFGLGNAMSRIEDHSWIMNGLPDFLKRLKEDRPYKCAALFVDNSGCDIVLGVMPFVRQLLKEKTRVILCANSEPALNDVTCAELKDIVQECCKICDKIAAAYSQQELVVYANGQTGPCLDMMSLPPDLCEVMLAMDTDFIVLEGMGRALHTNMHARFKCDTLKLAIVKNEWLAKSLGGKLFSVICKYERFRE